MGCQANVICKALLYKNQEPDYIRLPVGSASVRVRSDAGLGSKARFAVICGPAWFHQKHLQDSSKSKGPVGPGAVLPRATQQALHPVAAC